jgi:uncharacterized Zn finger protein
MSRRRPPDFRSFERGPRKPPPADGIRMKKGGTTWWGERWITALTQLLRGDAGRLARGRTYARAGRVHDLVLENGQVRAYVTGTRTEPYEVTIALGQLSPEAWERAIGAMAARAQFAAELLAGRMPEHIGEAFTGGASLFPAARAELTTRCTCPDWGDPCKHVAAAHYILGEALDRDPFLLFELRGRGKEQVLEALRIARSGSGGAAQHESAPPREVASVELPGLSASEYEGPPLPLADFHFAFDAPGTHAAVLRQLGKPAAWSAESSPAELLAPVLHAASERARQVALAEPPVREDKPASATPPDEPKRRRKPRTR